MSTLECDLALRLDLFGWWDVRELRFEVSLSDQAAASEPGR